MTRRSLLGATGALLACFAPGTGVAQQIVKPRPPLGGSGDPRIARWVGQVSAGFLQRTVETLSAVPTRWTESPNFPEVETMVLRLMRGHAAPGTEVARQAYRLPSGETRHNIVAGQPVTGREIIVVGAHFDSISEQPARLAPGANDNATGVAALVEAMRILTGEDLGRDLVFVAFSGEEQGLLGSTACRDVAVRDGWPIKLMINLDMLGWRPPDPARPFIVEYDRGNAVPDNDAASRSYGALAAQMAAAHTNLTVMHTDIWDSDYMPFEQAGFPCIGFYDGGAEGGIYHSSRDVADLVDFGRLEQATRMLVATIAAAAA